jgi:hypothetical protein
MTDKTGIEIVRAPFTDHEVVILRINLPTGERRRRRGRWKINLSSVNGPRMKSKIQQVRRNWTNSRKLYMDDLMWWESGVKPQLQKLIRREEAERRADYRAKENLLFECKYDILCSTHPPEPQIRGKVNPTPRRERETTSPRRERKRSVSNRGANAFPCNPTTTKTNGTRVGLHIGHAGQETYNTNRDSYNFRAIPTRQIPTH